MNVILAINKQQNLYKKVRNSIRNCIEEAFFAEPLTKEEEIVNYERFLTHVHHHSLDLVFRGLEPGKIHTFDVPIMSVSHKTNFPLSLESLCENPRIHQYQKEIANAKCARIIVPRSAMATLSAPIVSESLTTKSIDRTQELMDRYNNDKYYERWINNR